MKVFFKSKHINTPGVIDFKPIIDELEVYYQNHVIVIKLTFYNPTQHNVKINGLTMPPKGNLSFDFTSDFFTTQFNGYGFKPENIPDFTLDLPNKGGSIDVSVFYGNSAI